MFGTLIFLDDDTKALRRQDVARMLISSLVATIDNIVVSCKVHGVDISIQVKVELSQHLMKRVGVESLCSQGLSSSWEAIPESADTVVEETTSCSSEGGCD